MVTRTTLSLTLLTVLSYPPVNTPCGEESLTKALVPVGNKVKEAASDQLAESGFLDTFLEGFPYLAAVGVTSAMGATLGAYLRTRGIVRRMMGPVVGARVDAIEYGEAGPRARPDGAIDQTIVADSTLKALVTVPVMALPLLLSLRHQPCIATPLFLGYNPWTRVKLAIVGASALASGILSYCNHQPTVRT